VPIRQVLNCEQTLVQLQLGKDPFGGQLFVFRGRRSHLIKILWWDGQGLVLYSKRLACISHTNRVHRASE
jgi:transposase